MARETRIGLDEVVGHFAELEDPRSEINRRHPLLSVVVIALMGVLAGAGGPTAIAKWALMNEELWTGLLPLPHGIPRKDVFRRVLATLQPDAFQACYRNWLEALREKAAAVTGIDQPVLAIDGKTARRSHDQSKGLGALHSVSVWASEYGLSLGQVATEEKSHEITAIPVLLRLVDIRGAIITIDAMGCQTEIAAQIVDGQAEQFALTPNADRVVFRFDPCPQFLSSQSSSCDFFLSHSTSILRRPICSYSSCSLAPFSSADFRRPSANSSVTLSLSRFFQAVT